MKTLNSQETTKSDDLVWNLEQCKKCDSKNEYHCTVGYRCALKDVETLIKSRIEMWENLYCEEIEHKKNCCCKSINAKVVELKSLISSDSSEGD
jgi:hypothetical protein